MLRYTLRPKAAKCYLSHKSWPGFRASAPLLKQEQFASVSSCALLAGSFHPASQAQGVPLLLIPERRQEEAGDKTHLWQRGKPTKLPHRRGTQLASPHVHTMKPGAEAVLASEYFGRGDERPVPGLSPALGRMLGSSHSL